MNEQHLQTIAHELGLQPRQVQAAAHLLADGSTIPFIARYRKEATGSLDEVVLAAIRDRSAQLAALDQRRHAIVDSLVERDLLTDELAARLKAAPTLASLEDIYQPFRLRRRTRASQARDLGLQPLADILLRQDPRIDPHAEAARFIVEGIPHHDSALQGARDILAEQLTDDPDTRARMRHLFWSRGVLASRVRSGVDQAGEAARYRDYFDWSEPVRSAPSHRVLAMLRGEADDVLSVSIEPPEADAVAILESRFVRGTSRCAEQVRLAVRDGYKRLLARAMETETRSEARRRAEAAAIAVFARNLRQLLLAPPLGSKRVLAIDPGWRTGCKVVALDAAGHLLDDTVIYLDQGPRRTEAAEATLRQLVAAHAIEAIAIGNGTAGRETEAFVRSLGLPGKPDVIMVNESGASIYSASDIARAEFPDKDITVRGAVSIGRRLMDPLAELVKIDPKSIGVGQYQHAVDQTALKHALDDVVVSCVNAVGVEVNTASKELLAYVAGLNTTVAANIVRHRTENGAFRTRQDLKKVPRLGDKAFEQAAGFLRIRGAANPLDASAVHPESYAVVERMARDLGAGVRDLVSSAELRQRIDPARYVTETVGLPTLNDILAELARPGRDPRQARETEFRFADGVNSIGDLRPGMTLPGIVTNVAAFGAFVDVGVHQDGLVHISQLADRFVRDPNQVVAVQQVVTVTVLEVDAARKRISLSMRTRR